MDDTGCLEERGELCLVSGTDSMVTQLRARRPVANTASLPVVCLVSVIRAIIHDIGACIPDCAPRLLAYCSMVKQNVQCSIWTAIYFS